MRVRLYRSLGNVWRYDALLSAVVLALWYPLVIQAVKASSHFCCHDVHKLHASLHYLRTSRCAVCRLCLSISLMRTENSNFVEQFSEHYATTEWASFKNFIAQQGYSVVQSLHSLHIAELSSQLPQPMPQSARHKSHLSLVWIAALPVSTSQDTTVGSEANWASPLHAFLRKP